MIIRTILSGEEQGPRRDFLTLNNGASLYVSGKASSIQDGIALSRSLIDSGAGLHKLEELIAASQR